MRTVSPTERPTNDKMPARGILQGRLTAGVGPARPATGQATAMGSPWMKLGALRLPADLVMIS